MKKFLLVALVLLGLSSVVQAQNATATATQSASLELANAMSIVFTGTGTDVGGAVNLPFNTVADYANGVISAAQQLQVNSNMDFDVTVKTNAANFTYTGTYTTGTTMPVSGVLKLMVSANATGGSVATPFSTSSYATLTATDQNLINNGANGPAQQFSVQYMATPGFTYPGGTYTTNVIYTATQQ